MKLFWFLSTFAPSSFLNAGGVFDSCIVYTSSWHKLHLMATSDSVWFSVTPFNETDSRDTSGGIDYHVSEITPRTSLRPLFWSSKTLIGDMSAFSLKVIPCKRTFKQGHAHMFWLGIEPKSVIAASNNEARSCRNLSTKNHCCDRDAIGLKVTRKLHKHRAQIKLRKIYVSF